jgi:hypothetical protein
MKSLEDASDSSPADGLRLRISTLVGQSSCVVGSDELEKHTQKIKALAVEYRELTGEYYVEQGC